MKYVIYALITVGIIGTVLALREPDAEKCLRLVQLGNIQEAVKPCTNSGARGAADSQYILGVMHATGNGLQQDLPEAVEWYAKAAEQGHAGAQFNLGYAYYNGKGAPQDYEQAYKWYRAAALKHHPDAQHNLGLAYLNGHGAPQNLVNAYAWFSIAADQGQKLAIEARDLMTNNLTPEQLEQARAVIAQHARK